MKAPDRDYGECLSAGQIMELLDRQLTRRGEKKARRHLGHCAHCQQIRSELAAAGRPIQQYLACPDDETIAGYVDAMAEMTRALQRGTIMDYLDRHTKRVPGTLASDEVRRVHLHLHECPRCRARVAMLEAACTVRAGFWTWLRGLLSRGGDTSRLRRTKYRPIEFARLQAMLSRGGDGGRQARAALESALVACELCSPRAGRVGLWSRLRGLLPGGNTRHQAQTAYRPRKVMRTLSSGAERRGARSRARRPYSLRLRLRAVARSVVAVAAVAVTRWIVPRQYPQLRVSSAEVERRRSAVFFIQYLALLAAAAAWVQFPEVRARVGGHLLAFYLLLAGSACYVLFRAYVTMVRQAGRSLRDLWVIGDLGVITGAAYLTGGMNSEAALLYFWPIATSAIQRQPRRTITISVASGVLYFLATWADRTDLEYPGAMMARFVVLIIVSSLAVSFALAETTRIEELMALRAQVALADERSRMSQEVHDGILSYLKGIDLRLDLARKLIDTDPAEAARVATDQRFAIRQAMVELRCLTDVLRSPVVERGLAEALGRHFAVGAEGSPVAARLQTKGEVRPLPAEVERETFRIVQEAMVNAEKYARATEVRVRLCYAGNSFTCSIRDDGVGFDMTTPPKAASSASGLGLPSMEERAEKAGGELRITSAPGQGTEILFTVPLGAEAQSPQKGA